MHVLPPATSLKDFTMVATEAYLQKNTVGFSYDDAGVGALDEKTAVLWDIADTDKAEFSGWYQTHYPGTVVQFEDLAPPPPPAVDVGKWVDVSHHQGEIDWRQMADNGVTHAYIRATYGLNQPDSYVTQNVQGAQDNGIQFGLYHYFLNHQAAMSQAEYFLQHAPAIGELPPVLDIEQSLQHAPLNPGDVQIWLETVEFETGIVPVIYTSVNGWDGQLLTPQPWASEYKLWVAHWNDNVDQPDLPRDWDTWWLWQYGHER
jgi:lysozyme